MQTLEMPTSEELAEIRFEERELDILAFELWQLANCPEPADEQKLAEDEALRCHASCL
jgi:hypothetical protein